MPSEIMTLSKLSTGSTPHPNNSYSARRRSSYQSLSGAIVEEDEPEPDFLSHINRFHTLSAAQIDALKRRAKEAEDDESDSHVKRYHTMSASQGGAMMRKAREEEEEEENYEDSVSFESGSSECGSVSSFFRFLDSVEISTQTNVTSGTQTSPYVSPENSPEQVEWKSIGETLQEPSVTNHTNLTLTGNVISNKIQFQEENGFSVQRNNELDSSSSTISLPTPTYLPPPLPDNEGVTPTAGVTEPIYTTPSNIDTVNIITNKVKAPIPHTSKDSEVNTSKPPPPTRTSTLSKIVVQKPPRKNLPKPSTRQTNSSNEAPVRKLVHTSSVPSVISSVPSVTSSRPASSVPSVTSSRPASSVPSVTSSVPSVTSSRPASSVPSVTSSAPSATSSRPASSVPSVTSSRPTSSVSSVTSSRPVPDPPIRSTSASKVTQPPPPVRTSNLKRASTDPSAVYANSNTGKLNGAVTVKYKTTASNLIFEDVDQLPPPPPDLVIPTTCKTESSLNATSRTQPVNGHLSESLSIELRKVQSNTPPKQLQVEPTYNINSIERKEVDTNRHQISFKNVDPVSIELTKVNSSSIPKRAEPDIEIQYIELKKVDSNSLLKEPKSCDELALEVELKKVDSRSLKKPAEAKKVDNTRYRTTAITKAAIFGSVSGRVRPTTTLEREKSSENGKVGNIKPDGAEGFDYQVDQSKINGNSLSSREGTNTNAKEDKGDRIKSKKSKKSSKNKDDKDRKTKNKSSKNKTWTCDGCQTTNSGSQDFCENCHMPKKQQWLCSNCNKYTSRSKCSVCKKVPSLLVSLFVLFRLSHRSQCTLHNTYLLLLLLNNFY